MSLQYHDRVPAITNHTCLILCVPLQPFAMQSETRLTYLNRSTILCRNPCAKFYPVIRMQNLYFGMIFCHFYNMPCPIIHDHSKNIAIFPMTFPTHSVICRLFHTTLIPLSIVCPADIYHSRASNEVCLIFCYHRLPAR